MSAVTTLLRACARTLLPARPTGRRPTLQHFNAGALQRKCYIRPGGVKRSKWECWYERTLICGDRPNAAKVRRFTPCFHCFAVEPFL